jgi:hypothetical protein
LTSAAVGSPAATTIADVSSVNVISVDPPWIEDVRFSWSCPTPAPSSRTRNPAAICAFATTTLRVAPAGGTSGITGLTLSSGTRAAGSPELLTATPVIRPAPQPQSGSSPISSIRQKAVRVVRIAPPSLPDASGTGRSSAVRLVWTGTSTTEDIR